MAHGEDTSGHPDRRVHREKFEMPPHVGRTPKGQPGYYAEDYQGAVKVWQSNSEAGHDPGPYPVRMSKRPQ